MASVNGTKFQKAKAATRAVVLAGVTAAFALGAGGATQPALAADNIPAACRKVSSDALPDCIYNNLKQREVAAKTRGAAADARSAAAEAVIGCVAKLKLYKEKDPEGFKNLGLVTRENACSLAEEIGKRAALAPTAG
jgi:hypothetical protein